MAAKSSLRSSQDPEALCDFSQCDLLQLISPGDTNYNRNSVITSRKELKNLCRYRWVLFVTVKCDVSVNSEGLIGAMEYLTLY